MLFDAFCIFSASSAHHFASIARYVAQNDGPNLLENPSKIISNSNDRIGIICNFAAYNVIGYDCQGGFPQI